MGESHEMVVIIRPSFKRFCGADACQAATFNHLLYWIARKAKGEPVEQVKQGEVYWYGTAEEICEGMDNSWSVNKVRKEIKELVDAGLIGQRRNPKKGWDQTRYYFLSEEQGNAIREACEEHNVCLKHLGLSPDVLHLLNLVNAINKNGKCNCQISEMDLPNIADASTKFGNAIPKDDTKVTAKDTHKGKEREPVPSQQKTDPSSLLSDEELSFDELYRRQKYTYKPSKIDAKLKSQWSVLAPEIKTEEQLLSLFEYTHKLIKGDNPTVFPGNLVRELPGWIQQRDSESSNPFRSKPEPTTVKEESFIDELVRELAQEWHEPELLGSLISEVKAIYQRAGSISDAGFEMAAREVQEAMGDMDSDEARREGKESVSAYFLWSLDAEFTPAARKR